MHRDALRRTSPAGPLLLWTILACLLAAAFDRHARADASREPPSISTDEPGTLGAAWAPPSSTSTRR